MSAPTLAPQGAVEARREAVRRVAGPLNGIDFIEVDLADRTMLTVAWLKPLAAPVATDAWSIRGGERLAGLRVTDAVPVDSRTTKLMLDRAGDRSPYTVAVDPAAGTIDPLLARYTFRFFPDCEDGADCRRPEPDPSPVAEEAIDYTARDYAPLRQLLLDRLSRSIPDWTERNPADVAVMIAELLAYAGDRLAWRQDAVATEAALATARLRASVRRHARLMDYRLSEGGTARAWVRVLLAPGAGPVTLPAETRLFTAIPDAAGRIAPDWPRLASALAAGTQPFLLPLPSGPLYAAHAEMPLHAWGAPRAMLPAGTTEAVLRGSYPNLAPGMALVLAERCGPATGDPADADPTRRHPVRITAVQASTDPLDGSAITRVAWSAEDALPFALALASQTPDGGAIPDVAVAWGNVVLAEHGRRTDATSGSAGLHPDVVPPSTQPGGFRPRLLEGPVAWTCPVSGSSARAQAAVDRAKATPDIVVTFTPPPLAGGGAAGPPQDWVPVPDLLSSQSATNVFVVEPDGTGGARLLFAPGDGGRPPEGHRASVRMRIGGGRAGNVAREAIVHVASTDPAILGVVNPLPACGGAAPEPMAAARRRIPEAWRIRDRAVTTADYAAVAGDVAGIQRAAARRRWNGAWPVLQVALDPIGGTLDAAVSSAVLAALERQRLAGHGVAVARARPVPVELAVRLCLKPGYLAASVRRVAETLLTAQTLVDGGPGLFHPDRLVMGEAFALSPIVQALQQIDGVAHVVATRFERADAPGPEGLTQGRLACGKNEMFVLANDPDFPDRGRATLEVVAAT